MATTFLCQKAHMGSTTYYIGTMKAGALVRSVGYVSDLPEWNEMTVDERIQREIDETRIKQEIVPYLQQDKDRFFGALIVDIFKGWENLIFEPLKDVVKITNKAYDIGLENMGYLHLPGADYLVALDGQHRLKALNYAIFGDGDKIKSNINIIDDDITVIFVLHDDGKKIRNIFNKVNRYARSTSRGDNIITSEDDAFAILARRFLKAGTVLSESNVNWKSNTLSQRSTNFTTISAIYETIKIILEDYSELNTKYRIRPTDEELDNYFEEIFAVWDTVLSRIKLFENLESEIIVKYRKKYLIFKPAGLISMFQGIKIATKSGCELSEAVEKLNNINWDMSNEIWENIIIKPDGSIIAKAENRDVTARLIAYIIYGEHLSKNFKEKLSNDFITKKYGKDTLKDYNENVNLLNQYIKKVKYN